MQKIFLKNIRWSREGEPYTVSCLRLTVNGHEATIGIEQKPLILSHGIVFVYFINDDFDERILPTIVLRPERRIKFQGCTLERNFIASDRLVKLLKEMEKAVGDGTFQEGKVISEDFEEEY